MKITSLLFFIILFSSCNKSEFREIRFGNTLIENQTFSQNKRLCKAVEGTLQGDKNALIILINFNCGSASGCYDLGSVITQIVYKIGEDDFLKMVKKLNPEQKSNLRGFIDVGLEYGYRLNGKSKNKVIKDQFPKIDNELPK